MKIRLKVNPRTQQVSQALESQIKEEELKANDQEKCGWRPDCFFCKSQKKEEDKKPTAAEDIAKNTKNHRPRDPIL